MAKDGAAWTLDIDGDLVAILEAIIDAGALAGECPVYPGAAPKGARPPFVTFWPLDPERIGEGLAVEDWGRALGRWQVNPHGLSTGQARYLVEQITQSTAWPTGWSLEDVGPLVPDTADEPRTWFWPLDFKWNGTGAAYTPLLTVTADFSVDGAGLGGQFDEWAARSAPGWQRVGNTIQGDGVGNDANFALWNGQQPAADQWAEIDLVSEDHPDSLPAGAGVLLRGDFAAQSGYSVQIRTPQDNVGGTVGWLAEIQEMGLGGPSMYGDGVNLDLGASLPLPLRIRAQITGFDIELIDVTNGGTLLSWTDPLGVHSAGQPGITSYLRSSSTWVMANWSAGDL